MTNYYVQHGLYGAYSSAPSWGVAQDGDGLAMGAATPAVASLVINAVAAVGNTIAFMGLTLTAVASGASGLNFNVGATVGAQADNLATCINALTSLVSAATSPQTPQARNLLYARGPTLGAPAGTLQIMTRAGSALLNQASNAAVNITATGWSARPDHHPVRGRRVGRLGLLRQRQSGRARGGLPAWRSAAMA